MGKNSSYYDANNGIIIDPMTFHKSYITSRFLFGGTSNVYGESDASDRVGAINNVGTAALHDLIETTSNQKPILAQRTRVGIGGNLMVARFTQSGQEIGETDAVMADYVDYTTPHFRAYWSSTDVIAANQWMMDYSDTTTRTGFRSYWTTAGTLIVIFTQNNQWKGFITTASYADTNVHFIFLYTNGSTDPNNWSLYIDDMVTPAGVTVFNDFASGSTFDNNGLEYGQFQHSTSGSTELNVANHYINQEAVLPSQAFREALQAWT